MDKDSVTLRINASRWLVATTVEDSSVTMSFIVDQLIKNRNVERIVISENREIEYDETQTSMLKEIANLYYKFRYENEDIVKTLNSSPFLKIRMKEFFSIVEMIKGDPVGAYFKLTMLIKKLEDFIPKSSHPSDIERYINLVLKPLKNDFEKTKLISVAKKYMQLYLPGDRTIYRKIFNPVIRPKFMTTRYYLFPPKDGRLVERYKLYDGTTVEIYNIPEKIRLFYHTTPKEFVLKEEYYNVLEAARNQLMENIPTGGKEILDIDEIRSKFYDMGMSLLQSISQSHGIRIPSKELKQMANILVRYTAGFGILEVLLSDPKIQDIYINSPVGSTPIFVNHADYGECETNLVPTQEDAESWATRFRLYSGRPLDESNPVLDTDIVVPGGRARVAAITKTLSPTGLAFAFRRHRESPWTFPLFMKVKYFNPLYAGLMSFIIDGGRAIMIAGGRGSGKTSLLSAMLLELMRRYRLIIQEDTPELPVEMYRKLGYDVLRIKSRSVITHVETELSPEEALRTALRLGDSVLIVGEVRSKESTVLFEAMRIGALANMVAGTIHGESPYGVYDRVVHDLGVTPTSFKALDVISVCNVLTSPDGLHKFRRVVELTEVRKKWKDDPSEEGGFVPLMQYSAKEDELKPTEVLINGESEVLESISKKVREWHGSWDRVWENILLRANIKKTILDYSLKLNRPDILEAEWTVKTNEMFHLISADVAKEVGYIDPKTVYDKWLNWFKDRLKHE